MNVEGVLFPKCFFHSIEGWKIWRILVNVKRFSLHYLQLWFFSCLSRCGWCYSLSEQCVLNSCSGGNDLSEWWDYIYQGSSNFFYGGPKLRYALASRANIFRGIDENRWRIDKIYLELLMFVYIFFFYNEFFYF